MIYRIIIKAQAQSDLDETYRRIAQGSAERAAQWYNGIVDAIASLANFPERCAFARENAFFPEDIRQLLYGKRGNVYRVLFTIAQDYRPRTPHTPRFTATSPTATFYRSEVALGVLRFPSVIPKHQMPRPFLRSDPSC